jgi:hypothetical protein
MKTVPPERESDAKPPNASPGLKQSACSERKRTAGAGDEIAMAIQGGAAFATDGAHQGDGQGEKTGIPDGGFLDRGRDARGDESEH